MKYTAIAILLLLNSLAFCSDGETSAKPTQQIEKEIEEYKKLVTDFFQYNRVVATPRRKANMPIIGDSHRDMHLAMDAKKKEIVELHKALAIMPSTKLYEEARLRRIGLSIELEKTYKKGRKSDDAPLAAAEQMANEEMSIELIIVSLTEALNTPVSSGKETIAEPVSRIDQEIAEYKHMVTVYFQYNRVVGTSRRIEKLPPIGKDPPLAVYRAIQAKKEKIIDLYQSLALVPSTKLYEEASARRIVLMIELNIRWRKERDTDHAPLPFAEQIANEESSIELHMVALTAELNTPQ